MTRSGGTKTKSKRSSSVSADRARRTMIRRLLQRLDACRAPASECTDRTDVLKNPGLEVAGATILLGAALAANAGLERAIRNSAPVVIVEVPNAHWVEPMAKALAAVFGPDIERPPAPTEPGRRRYRNVPVVITAGAKSRQYDPDHPARISRAIRDYRTLIGVTGPVCPPLPDELLRACDERLAIESFDPEAVELLLEYVVGTAPDRRLSEDEASEIEPLDLRVAVHPARGAEGSLDRLSAILRKRLHRSRSTDVPLLQDLAGYGAAHEWGLAAAADLSAYAKQTIPWSACEHAVLLAGPPGTGKTSFAAALARQAGVPCLSGSLAQWQAAGEAHLGTTLKAMRAFFEAAGKAAPCVALIDEVDSFGDRRNFAHYARDYWTQLVNGLLECLDGAGGRAGILLVGTTNHPERIDPAILRSGRFDRCITIQPPSISDLAVILRHHLGQDLPDADLTDAARRAVGGTGADCAAWVRRARGHARRADRALTLKDLMAEIGHADEAPSQADDRRAAVHESGHAVVAHALGFELHAVTLHSGPGLGGETRLKARDLYPTGRDLRDQLAVYLAGRAAEILVLGAPSVGSAADLVAATELCGQMHCRWGLEGRITVRPLDPMPNGLDVAIERDLQRAFGVAMSILSQRRAGLDRLTELLIAQRSLESIEIERALEAVTSGVTPSITTSKNQLSSSSGCGTKS
ncbi:AAA family ATPase [Methylobacterium sp. J-077]|uniref:AAA family ATPase n=1 Tax=Methylobacterium sp. J-077 TaxID=2836656 RepID=UPI001FB8EB08|nr:AAA family ATPase [Methylobacterium sp. J-077]MCJ2121775.1 AAA family ATPase [Methylobacterium sp. J-077]